MNTTEAQEQKMNGETERVDFEDDGKPPTIVSGLEDIRVRKTVDLNVVTDCLAHWTCAEAFREIYQNWRDEIRRGFHISLRDFAPISSESSGVILIQQFHPVSKELCGYIRFKYNKNGDGELEVRNFNASLKYRHLKIGASTKAHDKNQSGKYGEGLKVAALIFRRFPNNHSFRIESSGFSWNFIFNQELDLACTLTRMSDAKLAQENKKAESQQSAPTSQSRERVSIFIGARRTSYTSMGEVTRGNKIHVDDFRKWLDVTLDINPPTDIVHTTAGDLILDPAYKNKHYLQGLLLPSGSMSGKPHNYGYNFMKGHTNRDRDAIAQPGGESRQRLAIWAAGIRIGGAKGDELLSIYTNLLLNSLNELGDVALPSKWPCLDPDIAGKVWKHMCTINQGPDGRPAFYYTATEGKDAAQIISQNLDLHPFPIGAELWNILRRFKLPRTPFEEQHHRFSHAAIVEVPQNVFALNLEWMLQCCINSHPATKRMGFDMVDGKGLAIDVAYFDKKWKIHDRWLTFNGAHQDTFCEEHCPEQQDPFCCDHAVLTVWNYMLSQVRAVDEFNIPFPAKDEKWLKSMTGIRISQMPRGVKCARNERRGELVVSWESVDSHKNRDKPVRVILHSNDCTGELQSSWEHPLNIMFNLKDEDRNCDCPSQLSQVASAGVTFTNLGTEKKYFASVSRDDVGAFIGLHPPAIRPLKEDLFVKQEPTSLNVDAIQSPVHVSEDAMESTDDTSNDDGDNEFGSPDKEVTAMSLSSPGTSSSEKGYTSRQDDAPQDAVSEAPVNDESHLPVESYVLGESLDHRSLDWGGSFPGSHNFYRTRDRPEDDVFIAKPKANLINENGKRMHDEPSGNTPARRSRPSFTPLPPNGIRYRY